MSDASSHPNRFSIETPPLANTPDSTLSGENGVLAKRFTRFAAAIVDGILAMLFLVPLQFMTGYASRISTGAVGLVEQLMMIAVGYGIFVLFHGYLLATRGQTIGKFLTNIQIVDVESERLASVKHVFVYRYLWLLPLTIIVAIVPGFADDILVNLVALVDVLFIFRQDRRCLHDLIASTKVVEYLPNRPSVNAI
ncbi:RDD family protein [Novipirellula herctigrandis]